MAVTGIDGRLYKDQASADKAAARLANAPDLSGTSKTTSTPTTQTTPTTPKTTTTTTTSGNGWGESNYKDTDGYYSATDRNAATGGAEFGTSPTKTTTTSTPATSSQDAGSKVRDAWNSFSYEKQQELLKNNPALQKGLSKYGAVNKLPEENVTAEGEEPVKSGTTKGNWDYQDNSPERMSEIADNVNKFAVTDPQLFANEDTFRNFFIDGKGRTPEQEKFLMDFYKNRKMYNTLDNYTAEQIGDKYVNGEIPESYLTYLKNTDPERYAYVIDAKAKAEDDIKDQANYDTISSISGDGEDLMTSKVIQWLKDNGLLVDKDGNLVDDRRENYASEEENKYLKEIADLNARNLEIDNVVKHTYEDYVKKYPGATKATLMALAQDTNADLLREKENNMVELTKFQGYVNYMQSERQEMNAAGADTISQLQKQYGMYYDYTPQGMAEMAQMQYAATNVTLTQADTGNYTQKQMALDSALTPYYEMYGDILFTSKAEAIDQAINYAKQNGVSLQKALDETFYKDLYNNPYYLQKIVGDTGGYGDWKVIGKDDLGNDVYGFVNTSTGVVVPYGTVSGGYDYGTGYTGGAGSSSGNYIDVPRNVNGYKDNIGADTNNFGNITSMVEGAIGMYHSPNGRDYAVFANAEDGYNALLRDLQGKQTGNTRTGLNGNSTVAELIGTWVNGSGSVDPNSRYAKDFIKASGLSLNDKIGNVSTEKLAKGIMAGEGTLGAYNKGGVDLAGYTPAQTPTTDQTTGKFDKSLGDVYDEFADASDKDKTKIASRYGKTRQQMDAEAKEYEGWRNAQDVKPLIDEIDRLLDGEVDIPPRLQRMKTVGEDIGTIANLFTVGKISDRNYRWMALHNHIYNTLGMEKFIDLKNRKATFGALSDSERKAIYDAASAFQAGLDEEEYKNQLRLIRDTLVQSGRGYLDNYHYQGGTTTDMANQLGFKKVIKA